MAAHPARSRRLDARVVVLSVLLVVALLAWFGVDYVKNRLASGGCDTTTPVRITAAPDVAPVLSALARSVPEADCYTVDVTASASTATATALEANGANGPDVWVPESSTWLLQARDGGAWNLPETGQSVASSPVVLALTDEVAKQAGWPAKSPSWSDVVAGSPVGLPDPGRDPAGIAALIGLQQLTKNAPDPAAAFTEEIRRLSAVKEPYTASPASEQSVLARKLVAAYPAVGVPSFDYPYVVLPRASEASRTASERFLRLLLDQAATKAFADAGFRTPTGQFLGDRAPDTRTSAAPRPVGPPTPEAMYGVLQAWAGANLSARVQVLLDVSGSMAATVPGTGRSRMALTLEAATQGLGLFKPTTELGLWLFSTKLDGDRDYKELLPMRSIADQLAQGGLTTLQAVKPKPGGATGLYDSILAAYQNARQSWKLGRINVVVVLTDGRNEDSDSIGLPGLLAELGKLQDPRKPLPVIGIGIGPDIDAGELRQVSAATGGESFTTPDPRKISDVFYQALSKLMCQPPACKK
ncbi:MULTISPECIES: substrate-binding and VWA domain-containing protein [unclassified Amycolatopsis]|uniref:substrate-binding and VWA domain-containing protein n=1 Tax=unclassified Amycolatopsis TaxID=2618356 RepID=UPI001FF517E4|nr:MULTISPECIES: substrate-binding and VWA domain-containing protein [unclassified Amycolatopsis]UOZ07223.1 substrate-binding and VWA domain-containing protein [Amycolatopsis sp. WQ 127309]WSK82873.1 substrate-binding and VWA domain-containing protein [Amycolatopsis sp. NBC_01286]